MLLPEKLLYAFAVLMQIWSILVQRKFLIKIAIFTFLLGTYFSFSCFASYREILACENYQKDYLLWKHECFFHSEYLHYEPNVF